jgi:hypothetical protein
MLMLCDDRETKEMMEQMASTDLTARKVLREILEPLAFRVCFFYVDYDGIHFNAAYAFAIITITLAFSCLN